MWSQKNRTKGKATYSERYKDPLTGRYKTASVTIRTTGRKSDEKVAEEALNARINEILGASGTEPARLTLKALCEKYVARQRREFKEQTAVSSRMHLNTVRALIGDDALVKNLNANLVRDRLWSEDPVTYNGRLKIFKSMMQWAYKAELVNDISYLVKLEKRKTPPARVKDAQKYLEHEEIQALLDGMKVDRWKNLTEFLLLSGLRIGEAIALRDTDVDTQNRVIHVRRTYSAALHRITSSPKTDTSVRDIYMQDELLAVCLRIKTFEKERQLMYAYRSELFMSKDDGTCIGYDTYAKYFRENTEHLLGRRLTPHVLRHTHTALLAESGIPLEDISARLGHADSKITKAVYLHVTDKMKEKANERIKSVKMLTIC